MGISGKMEESGKQRQTNLRIVRGNPIGMVRKKKKNFTASDTERMRRGKNNS